MHNPWSLGDCCSLCWAVQSNVNGNKVSTVPPFVLYPILYDIFTVFWCKYQREVWLHNLIILNKILSSC